MPKENVEIEKQNFISIELAEPGHFLIGGRPMRILQVLEEGKKFKVRAGRMLTIVDLEATEWRGISPRVFVGTPGCPLEGHIYDYEYCRGSEYSGTALCKGVDSFESWFWMLKGENHFHTPSGSCYTNFVIANDSDFKMISIEEDLELGNI